MSITAEDKRRFLHDLTKLSKKHGISIYACGCCGSPDLDKLESSNGLYALDIDHGGYKGFEWVTVPEQ